MTPQRQFVVGKTLAVLGCLWFFLVLFRIRPLFVTILIFLTWLKPRIGVDELLTIIFEREYMMAAATVFLGVLMWRRATTKKWPLKLTFVALALSVVGGGAQYGWKA